ncbi:MAG: hypothetical protein U0L88_04045 [Acutalibacteraceae bacterium]|nr:hypothetical protein [Acutalibacteraceae bacterium]
MTDANKLAELIKKAESKMWGKTFRSELERNFFLAEELLANGVFLLPEDLRGTEDFSVSAFIEATQMYKEKDRYIKLPCKVGDKVWDLHQRYNGTFTIREGKISMITQKADKSWHLRITVNSSVWGFTPNEIGTRYFLTKEEAEQKLKELKSDD